MFISHFTFVLIYLPCLCLFQTFLHVVFNHSDCSDALQEVDVAVRGPFGELWERVSEDVQSLRLWGVEISQRNFVCLLQQCSSLEELWLDDMAHLLMPGTP